MGTQNNEEEIVSGSEEESSREETHQGAEESVATKDSQQTVNLSDLDEFRRYQSSMDRQLTERDQAIEDLQKKVEAMESARDYDQQQVTELRQQQEQKRAVEQRKQEMASAWGDMPGWDNAILDGVATVDQIEQRVYTFLRGLGKSKQTGESEQKKQQKQKVAESGVDESPTPSTSSRSPAEPVGLDEQIAVWRQEARETGKDRLQDWLSASEPVYPTKGNQAGEAGSGPSKKSKV